MTRKNSGSSFFIDSFFYMLEISNLKVTFRETKKEVFSGLNFSINSGEIVAIVGPSGCGKTTLLNIISGLLDFDEVEVSGTINKKSSFEVKYVFQDSQLLPWRNVYSNIRLGLEIKSKNNGVDSEKIQKLIEIVGLKEYDKYYPMQLSKGMAQRVNFARALVCEPDMLLLDEPFSALDHGIKKKIQKEFLEIIRKKNITTIFVTHDLEEARVLADRIMLFPIKKGDSLREISKDEQIKLESYFEIHENK